jgi:uncharacterized transporter YbjL
MEYTLKQSFLILLIILILGGVAYDFVMKNNTKKETARIQQELIDEGNRQSKILRMQKEEIENKDKENLNKENEEERVYVEKYVRENIGNITKQQEVLGGTWYVVSIKIDTEANKGEVIYEDGHIQAAADFSYEYDWRGIINMTNFEKKKL